MSKHGVLRGIASKLSPLTRLQEWLLICGLAMVVYIVPGAAQDDPLNKVHVPPPSA